MTINPFLTFGKKTYIMGILNITPDSFSGDGLMSTKNVVRTALDQAHRFVDEGADVLDIGGESTRPGAEMLSEQEEIDRVIPVIEALRLSGLETILSVDTYKSGVAEAALNSGAHWLNDVWALRADPKMAEVAARCGTPIILMHNRSKQVHLELQKRLGGRYVGVPYENLIKDIKKELTASVKIALQAGVKKENIILDPGIGFGKTVEQNLTIVNRLNEIKALGYPVLLGASRKSFIGYTLNLPPEDRVEGTAAVCAIGIARGADILRVHDVKIMARIAQMTDALVRI
jgi:dihydropteroate synthase